MPRPRAPRNILGKRRHDVIDLLAGRSPVLGQQVVFTPSTVVIRPVASWIRPYGLVGRENVLHTSECCCRLRHPALTGHD